MKLFAYGAPLILIAASPAQAEAAPRLIISAITPAKETGRMQVEVTLLNGGPDSASLPEEIPATLTLNGQPMPVTLVHGGGVPSAAAAAEGGFVQGLYQFALPAGVKAGEEASLMLDAGDAGAPRYAFAAPASEPVRMAEKEAVREPMPIEATLDAPSAKPDLGNAYLGNLSSYQPIYAVYGPGTNSDGRLQISFKYQLFGDAGEVGPGAPFINGLHFGFTQKLFWDLGGHSSPFRNIDFMPEIFYLAPAVPVSEKLALGGQIGLRHESNGRDGDASRSLNNVYVQTMATMPIGDYKLSIGPRLWFFVGDKEDNSDIAHYRGNTGLFAEIGKDDGFRLTTATRLNFGSGKGSFDAEVSYPLDRIISTPLNLYLFGQGFVGYGENLLDYNRRTTRLRFGIGIVR